MAALGMLCFSVLLQTILTFATNLGSQWVNCNMQAPGVSEFSFGLSGVAVELKETVFDNVLFGTSVKYETLAPVSKVVGEIDTLITATSAVYWLCVFGLLFGFVAVSLGAAGAALGKEQFFVGAGSVLLFDFLLTFIGWAVFNFGVCGELRKLKLIDIVKAVMKIGGGSMTLLQGFLFSQATKCTDQSSMTGSTLTALTMVLLLLASISVLSLSCVMCCAPKPQEMGQFSNAPMMQGRQAGAMQMQQMPHSGGNPYGGGAWPPSGGPGGPPGRGPPPPPMQMQHGNGRSPTGY